MGLRLHRIRPRGDQDGGDLAVPASSQCSWAGPGALRPDGQPGVAAHRHAALRRSLCGLLSAGFADGGPGAGAGRLCPVRLFGGDHWPGTISSASQAAPPAAPPCSPSWPWPGIWAVPWAPCRWAFSPAWRGKSQTRTAHCSPLPHRLCAGPGGVAAETPQHHLTRAQTKSGRPQRDSRRKGAHHSGEGLHRQTGDRLEKRRNSSAEPPSRWALS